MLYQYGLCNGAIRITVKPRFTANPDLSQTPIYRGQFPPNAYCEQAKPRFTANPDIPRMFSKPAVNRGFYCTPRQSKFFKGPKSIHSLLFSLSYHASLLVLSNEYGYCLTAGPKMFSKHT